MVEKKTILKIIKEETSQVENDQLKSRIKKFIKILTKNITFPDNFYDFAIDIKKNEYGQALIITTLMEKPFSQNDSDRIYSTIKKIKPQITSFFNGLFYDIYIGGISTLENYNQNKNIPNF